MRKKSHSEKVKLSDSDEWADIFVNGRVEPHNPGCGGWGYIVLIRKQEVHRECGSFQLTTNNRMELVAAIKGIMYAIQNNGVKFVKLYSDSQYIIKGISWWVDDWARAKYEGKLNVDLWKQLFEIKKTVSIKTFFVKSNVGNPYKKICDDLAYNASIEHVHSVEDTEYLIYAERVARENELFRQNMINRGEGHLLSDNVYQQKHELNKEMGLFCDLHNT